MRGRGRKERKDGCGMCWKEGLFPPPPYNIVRTNSSLFQRLKCTSLLAGFFFLQQFSFESSFFSFPICNFSSFQRLTKKTTVQKIFFLEIVLTDDLLLEDEPRLSWDRRTLSSIKESYQRKIYFWPRSADNKALFLISHSAEEKKNQKNIV